MLSRFRATTLIPVILLLVISNSALLTAHPATGSFTMSVVSYTVTGGLTDVTGHQSHVKLLMSIDQSFSTSRGNVHIVGSGVWNGEVSGSIITGSVDNITGTVHACVLLTCKDVGFSGSGNWTGTVTTSSGSPKGAGTFQGGLSFSNLKPPSTVPVTGNWTSTLNI